MPTPTRRSGQKSERTRVPRPDDTEVTAVKGGDLHDPEPLGGGQHRGIDGAQRQVVVSGDELGDADQVKRMYRLQDEVPGREVAEKPDLWLPTKVARDQVGNLGDHEHRNDQRPRVCL